MDAIDTGYVLDSNGTIINIYTPEGLNILGNLIEGNSDSCNLRYYGMYEMLTRNVFGPNFDYTEKDKIVPSAMQFYSTSMRDPAFYALFNKISNYVDRLALNICIPMDGYIIEFNLYLQIQETYTSLQREWTLLTWRPNRICQHGQTLDLLRLLWCNNQ